MAEVRVTQVGALAEVAGAAEYVTQAGVLAEISGAAEYVTQFGVLVEIGNETIRVTQFGVLVEFEPRIPIGGGDGGRTAAMAAAASQASTLSRAAAGYANELFASLAASQASAAPGTVLSSGAGGIGAGGVSEVRTISAQVLIYWNGVTATDETGHLVSVRGSQTLAAPEQLLAGGRGAVASCQIVLSNHDSRYSPRNSAGALYAYIGAGKSYLAQVRINVTVDGTIHRLFTGVIREMNESAPTARQVSTVTLECRSRDELLLQDKRSTELADFIAGSAAAHTEDYHIIQLLELAGQADGVDFVSQEYASINPAVLPTIDPGVFPLRYMWLDDESVLDEVWSLVAACCGWFYCDASGKFRYHNIMAVLPSALARQFGAITTIDLTESQIAGLRLVWPTAELYGEVTIEISPRSPGEVGEIWKPDDVVVVQPGQTKTVWARIDAPMVTEPTLEWAAFTSGGVAITSGISITQTYYAQRVKLVIENTSAKAAYFRTLKLTGQTLTGGRTVEVETASSVSFWTNRPTRKRSIRNNVYIQAEAQAETIAAYLLKRQELPTLVCTVPNLDRADVRLGWPVAIQYTGSVPSAGEITGIVSGLSWSMDRTGFHQDATILETGSLYAGYDPFFVVGTNKLGATGGALEGYLFY